MTDYTQDPSTQTSSMHIPWDALDAETLTRLLSEIVTRDGTDYGAVAAEAMNLVGTLARAFLLPGLPAPARCPDCHNATRA